MLLLSIWIIKTSLLENYVSRQREYAADAFAVVQGYGIELAQALRAICVLEKREQLLKRPNLVAKIIYLFHSHPPMASRISAIENISQGSEGIVKDKLEKTFTAVVLAILWTVGLFFLKPTTIWSIGTVPLLYVTGPLFLFLIYLMLTSPTGVHNPQLFELEQKKGKEQTDIAFAIAALLFIAAFVVTGALSLIWSAILLGLSWIVPVGLLTAMVGLTFRSNTVAKRTMYSLAMLSAAIIVIVSLATLLIG